MNGAVRTGAEYNNKQRCNDSGKLSRVAFHACSGAGGARTTLHTMFYQVESFPQRKQDAGGTNLRARFALYYFGIGGNPADT